MGRCLEEKFEELACRIEKLGAENICVTFYQPRDFRRESVYRLCRKDSGEVFAEISAEGEDTRRLAKALARRRIDAFALLAGESLKWRPTQVSLGK